MQANDATSQAKRAVKTTIRPEQPGDYAAIAKICRLAFGGEGESRLVAALRASDEFDPNLSLVAVRDRAVIGHILFSPIRIESDQGHTPALALAPMAVLPVHQRQSIGTQLVHRGLEACRRLRHAIVVVVGHAEYYPRFGFTPAAPYNIQAPFPVPDEAFMVLALTPVALDGVNGVVRYPKAFDDVS
ncbi:MAG: N-acetyltransferase [bacterium]|nr:N-acetyltransferase [bacterium]